MRRNRTMRSTAVRRAPAARQSLATLYLTLGLAVTCTLALAIWLIGGEVLRTLALILVGGLMLALLTFVSAFPVKAWRLPKTPPPVVEKHFIHDGTRTIERHERHTIDGRTVEAPKLFQLPAQSGATAFPELLRAAYQSGLLSQERSAELPIDAEVRRLPPANGSDHDDYGNWLGDIMP